MGRVDGPGRGIAVAAVADGCGEGEASELGARLSAIAATRAAAEALRGETTLEGIVSVVAQSVLVALEAVCRAAAGDDRRARASFAREHLAATLWLAIARDDGSIVFGWGDGVLAIDDRVVVVDREGRPDYLVSALGGAPPAPTEILHASGARRLAVATDGWSEDDLRALPRGIGGHALLRWMRRRQREGAFRDDAAIAEVALEDVATMEGGAR